MYWEGWQEDRLEINHAPFEQSTSILWWAGQKAESASRKVKTMHGVRGWVLRILTNSCLAFLLKPSKCCFEREMFSFSCSPDLKMNTHFAHLNILMFIKGLEMTFCYDHTSSIHNYPQTRGKLPFKKQHDIKPSSIHLWDYRKACMWSEALFSIRL